jgi:hypothetical protein
MEEPSPLGLGFLFLELAANRADLLAQFDADQAGMASPA